MEVTGLELYGNNIKIETAAKRLFCSSCSVQMHQLPLITGGFFLIIICAAKVITALISNWV